MAKKTVKKKTEEKITKDMAVGDVVTKWPETVGVFMRHGMHCIGCAIAAFENIEQGAKAHGINVKKLIDDLNKAIKKK